jgi:hypothetical protein
MRRSSLRRRRARRARIRSPVVSLLLGDLSESCMWGILFLAFMNKTWDSGVDDVFFLLVYRFEGRAVYDCV